MKLARYVKTPSERKRYLIDYSDWLETGETVASVTFAVTPSTTDTLQIDAYTIDVDNVIFFASHGDDNNIYTVDVKMYTSGGQIKEDTIYYTVRSAL